MASRRTNSTVTAIGATDDADRAEVCDPYDPRQPDHDDEAGTVRHLVFAYASREPAVLVLLENDSTEVVTYRSESGSFRLIERDGRMFRLQGRDRETGEHV